VRRSVGIHISPDVSQEIARIDEKLLLFDYRNIHSQQGQDGILAKIFRRLSIRKGCFVECGAWDGTYLSNCYISKRKAGRVFSSRPWIRSDCIGKHFTSCPWGFVEH
jgi:hypothetical protein